MLNFRLQAFDPPLDMSVDMEVCENGKLSSTQSASNGNGSVEASKPKTINKAFGSPDWLNPSMQFPVPLSDAVQELMNREWMYHRKQAETTAEQQLLKEMYQEQQQRELREMYAQQQLLLQQILREQRDTPPDM